MRMLFRGQPLQDEGGNVQMVKAKSLGANLPSQSTDIKFP
jgi:hypothetical protein